jgi:protein PhnA
MARGRDAHDARKAALAALGKDLARRARSKCELCGASGPLSTVEPPPAPAEPELDAALLVCGTCADAMAGRSSPDDLRFLESAVWSELPIAQVVAVRLVERLAADGVDWAATVADQLWVDEAIRARIDAH